MTYLLVSPLHVWAKTSTGYFVNVLQLETHNCLQASPLHTLTPNMVASIPNDIFQFSTYAALEQGFNDGQPRASDLTSHGTHGLGTFEDGDLMILSDGLAYAVHNDHTVQPAAPTSRLPFAMVTVFQPLHIWPSTRLNLQSLESQLSSLGLLPGITGKNSLLPFQIEGTFRTIKVVAGKASDEPKALSQVRGTIFGFAVPAWLNAISGPRLHCHFLSEDDGGRSRMGGKVADFEVAGSVNVMVGKCGRFHLGFPQSDGWEAVKLS